MEQPKPRHLSILTTPLIIITALVLWWRGGPWWQASLLLFGMELWDLGWHSSVHHPNLFLSKPVTRVAGLVVVALALLAF